MAFRRTVYLDDVGGRFARFIRQAPLLVRAELGKAVKTTTESLAHRMSARAPVGPDAPHIRDEQDAKSKGLSGRAGIIGNDEEAHHALYNEYSPNHQPFMMPAAFEEEQPFKRRAIEALLVVEQVLSRG